MLIILNGPGNINLGKNSSKECNSKHVANMAEKKKKSQDENLFSKTDEVIYSNNAEN